MKKQGIKKQLIVISVVFWLLAFVIFAVAHKQFDHVTVENEALSATMTTAELCDGHELRQNLVIPADVVTDFCLMSVPSAGAGSALNVEFLDAEGNCIGTARAELGSVVASKYSYFPLTEPITGRVGEMVTVVLTTENCEPGNAIIVYFGNSVIAGKFDIVRQVSQEECFTMDGIPGQGILCVKMSGQKKLGLQGVYWLFVCSVFAVAAVAAFSGFRKVKAGKPSLVVNALDAVTKYRFLMKQLVTRDFMTKYKRSVLGVFWSFLNPLLTMAVQYAVFSTLFRSDTPYYAVYLLTGLVFFGFFSEACSMGITSITGNAALIKKVYMPKYIYPVSRVISSMVNLGFSLIPLFGVALLSGLALRLSILLLVFDLLCLLMFVTGMVLILSTMMTFFQDTQFLWGVASMMWMYLTPIFYPESIVPAKLLTLYHMNPMYQYITFARICIINGTSPAPTAYLWCMISAFVVLLAGLFVFKRNQDKFVLYL